MTTFSSVLSATIRSHLTLKRALGRQYAAEEWVLAHLDRFLAARRVDLNAETFGAWCLTLEHLASGTRRGRMRVRAKPVSVSTTQRARLLSSRTSGCFRRSTRPSGRISSPTVK